MENNEAKAKKILNEYNQSHIIRWIDKVDEETKKQIINQVNRMDLEELKDLYNKVKRGIQKKEYKISQIKAKEKDKISETEKKELVSLGETLITNSKYGVITMAGGQGSRLRT